MAGSGSGSGKVTTHQLLHTVFPAPLDKIEAELLCTGRWEGELVRRRPLAILETDNEGLKWPAADIRRIAASFVPVEHSVL